VVLIVWSTPLSAPWWRHELHGVGFLNADTSRRTPAEFGEILGVASDHQQTNPSRSARLSGLLGDRPAAPRLRR
jgi:hypothetical protein